MENVGEILLGKTAFYFFNNRRLHISN